MSNDVNDTRSTEAVDPSRRPATERLQAIDPALGRRGLARAAEILRGGGTVAFPTETVYGLGANAFDKAAVAKIFLAKQRPEWDPLIVHVDGQALLERVAVISDDLIPRVEALMKAFWPGPLTLLLPRTALVPDAVTAGRPLVGVRLPAHPVARELIRLAGVPIAAPSANRFGHTSPTSAAHVLADLDGRIDAVLDDGPTSIGVESTVLDATEMMIYRPGAVTAAMMSRATGLPVRTFTSLETEGAVEGLPSPGLGMRHYAPRARLILVESQEGFLKECQAELVRQVSLHPSAEVGVMLPDDWPSGGAGAVFRWGPWENVAILARLLFAGLRVLDGRGVRMIVCPVPEAGGLGDAIRDRLEKAARAK